MKKYRRRVGRSSKLGAALVRPRLSLEQLEHRRVLSAVSGQVIEDLNGNGVIEAAEPGQAGVRVFVDANGNDMLDLVGSVVEPDDFAVDQSLEGAVPGISFSLVDETNTLVAPATPILAKVDSLATTGSQVFGYQQVTFFHHFRRLRIDFSQPVSSVALDFAASRPFAPELGVLDVYDATGTLLERFETGEVFPGGFETMQVVRGDAEISYAVAYTKREHGASGRLDALRVDGQNSEAWTITRGDGSYRLDHLPAGTHRINELVPSGFQQTFPGGDGTHLVTLGADQTVSGIDFANRLVVNHPPVARDDLLTVEEDTSGVADVLANDSDDGELDVTSVMITGGPGHGQVEVNATNGEVTYTPEADFSGTDEFRYTVADNAGLVSEEATVRVTVLPVNDAPVAVDDTISTPVDTAIAIDVLANDTDVDSQMDPTSVVITVNPQNGILSVNASTGVVTYTPATGYEGIDTFRYTVADAEGLISNEGIVTIRVGQVPAGWQNSVNPLDVNNDGGIFPIDALLVINELNQPRFRDPVTGQLPPAPDPVPLFVDVNGDGFASPIDAILIINFLNAQAAQNAVATDLALIAAALDD